MIIDIKNLPEIFAIKARLEMSNEGGYMCIREVYRDDMESMNGYSVVSEDFEFSVKALGRAEITKKAVTDLRGQIQEIRGAAELQCKRIDETIQSMLALPEINQ